MRQAGVECRGGALMGSVPAGADRPRTGTSPARDVRSSSRAVRASSLFVDLPIARGSIVESRCKGIELVLDPGQALEDVIPVVALGHENKGRQDG